MDDRFDPLIDDVAKAMTSAPADDRLAARVAARIGESPFDSLRSLRAGRWTWIFVPIAAAAVLIVAVFMSRPEPTHEVAIPRGADVTVASAPLPKPIVAPTRIAMAKPIVPIALAPAPSLDPIEIDPIAVQPLVETKAIQLAPIAIDRIDIAAMP